MTGQNGEDGGRDDGQHRTPREVIKQRARELDVDVDHLLIGSRRRDPMFKGSQADHAKAEWFAELWERAVEGRDGSAIHTRGVHYFILMSMDEDFGLDYDAIPVELSLEDLPTLPDDLLEPPTDCSWDRYRNTKACFDYLKNAANLARILGYIPMQGIADEKHDQRVVTRYEDHRCEVDAADTDPPGGVRVPRLPAVDAEAKLEFDPEETDFPAWAAGRLADDLADTIEFDHPTQAPFHIELWCEKTLPDYIKRICREMGVNAVVEGEGDLSLTVAWDFAQRVQAAGKPAVVLYLSDHDPRGHGMAVNMASKLAWLDQRGDLPARVFIEPLAVTSEQVEAYNLPTTPVDDAEGSGTGAKAYDTLSSTWQARHGEGATELNVLEGIPKLYKHVVRSGLEPYTDPSLADQNSRVLQAWKERAEDAIAEQLREAGLDDLEELHEWIDAFNDRLDDARDVLEDLDGHIQDGYLREWAEELDDAVDDVEYPVVEVPDGEGATPEDPLFDSERDYAKNVARIDRYQRG